MPRRIKLHGHFARHVKKYWIHKQLDDIRGHKDALPKSTQLKNNGLFIAELYYAIGDKSTAQRVAACSRVMRFATDKSKKHRMCYLRHACHNRFCPNCQYVKSRKNTRVLSTILKYLMDKTTKAGNPIYRLAFTTLTIPDATPIYTKNGKELDAVKTGKKYRATVDIMNKAVTKFLHLPALDGVHSNGRILGSVVKVEATIKRNLALNAHNHLIIALHGSYYNGRYYLTHDKWVKLWNKAVLTTCKQCLNTHGHSKFGQPWHKSVAKQLYKSIHKLLADGKGGLNMHIEPLYWKKMTTWIHGNKTYKRVKKVRLNKDNAKKVAPHAAAEVSKYETKSQDFSSMIKHGVPKKRVFGIFKSVNMAYKGVHGLKFFGVFNKALKKFRNGDLDKYTESYQNNIIYCFKEIARFHNNKKKILRYYLANYYHLTDFEKIYFRKKLHVKTPYTTDEKHNNFNSKHDKKLADLVTGKLAREHAAKDFKRRLKDLDIVKVYWRNYIIHKLWLTQRDYYKYLGCDDNEADLKGARKVSHMIDEPKVKDWVFNPSRTQRHDFRLYLLRTHDDKFPVAYPSIDTFKESLFDEVQRMHSENEELKAEKELRDKESHKQVLVEYITKTPWGDCHDYNKECYRDSLKLVRTDDQGRNIYHSDTTYVGGTI